MAQQRSIVTTPPPPPPPIITRPSRQTAAAAAASGTGGVALVAEASAIATTAAAATADTTTTATTTATTTSPVSTSVSEPQIQSSSASSLTNYQDLNSHYRQLPPHLQQPPQLEPSSHARRPSRHSPPPPASPHSPPADLLRRTPRASSPASRVTRSAARRANQAGTDSAKIADSALSPSSSAAADSPTTATSSSRPVQPSSRLKRKAPESNNHSPDLSSSNPQPSPSTPSPNSRPKKQRATGDRRVPAAATGSTSRSRRGGQKTAQAAATFASMASEDPPNKGASSASTDASSRRKNTRSRKSDTAVAPAAAATDSPSVSRASTRQKRSSDAKQDEEMPDAPATPSAAPRRKHHRKSEKEPDPAEEDLNKDEDVLEGNDNEEEEEEGEDDDDEEGEEDDGIDDPMDEGEGDPDRDDDDDQDDEGEHDDDEDLDEEEHLRNAFLSRFGGAGAFGAGRLFGGLMSGSASHGRLREMLDRLKSDDPSSQMVGLQDLSSFLLISTEDNLAGQMSPDQFVRELVKLMQPNEVTGEVNEEMELMACRCIANLMEALPQATAAVVFGGAIPIICGKLLMINSIEVAEQALTTLEKISVDYGTNIVREGGLSACLGFLDFFPTGTQRSAVTTVANSCRNIPDDCFHTVRDIMPILEVTLNNADQRVVEQASLSVSRICESFKNKPDKLEQLLGQDMLRAILRLLMPGSTNLIPADIHTKFLRVIAFTARASPSHSAALIGMDVVDTLYQILTGVSPPPGSENVSSHIDGVVIMQALIRKQREQIYETLNVICELLPGLSPDNSFMQQDGNRPNDGSYAAFEVTARGDLMPKPQDADRRKLLGEHKEKLRRFATILLPTLTHAYTSTVNLSVRQKVLASQIKMLSNFDVDILEGALKSVPLASYLASILSQQDHPVLVLLALQAARLLFDRLGHIYAYQFCREGVLSEIQALADRPFKVEAVRPSSAAPSIESPPSTATADPSAAANSVPQLDRNDDENTESSGSSSNAGGNNATAENADEAAEHNDEDDDDDDDDDEEDGPDGDDDDDDEDEDDEDDDDDHDVERALHDEISPSPSDSTASAAAAVAAIERDAAAPRHGLEDAITRQARKFMEDFDKTRDGKTRSQANAILEAVRTIAKDLQQCYGGDDFKAGPSSFKKLAKYFGGDALETVTSAEILGSDLIDVLLEIFTSPDEAAPASKLAFLQVFMDDRAQGAYSVSGTAGASSAFSALVHKLQDLLSRSEHFEVITVHSNSHDGGSGGGRSSSSSSSSSATSMLAKQLRLKLVADGESDIPRSYRSIMVSIHAIATFKALDDYLRPRLSLGDRPRGLPRGSDLLQSLANAGITPEARQRLTESGIIGTLAGMPPPLPSMPAPTPSTPSESRRQSRRKSGRGAENAQDPDQTPQTPPQQQQQHQQQPAASADATAAPPSLRRTSRPTRSQQAVGGSETPATTGETIECADERQLIDDNDEAEPALARTSLAGVAGNSQGERGETPDPSAVNMEVASSGKVTARQEDGTRIPTPSQTATSTPPQAGTPSQSRTRAGPSSLSSSTNAAGTSANSASNQAGMSYAAAIRSTPQDWHIEFSIDGQPVNIETTIYRAVHYRPNQPDEPASRNLWSSVHPITFKRVPGPPPEPTTLSPPPETAAAAAAASEASVGSMPASLHKNPRTSKILRLLNILHEMNEDLESVLDDQRGYVKAKPEPASLFVNTKLTAKLNRQLEEPLVVASNCLPGWSEDLARLYPFLFPFETRHLFLQSTSFGYSRLMNRWQNTQSENSRRSRRHDDRPFMGRLQRQKVRISRSRILESAMKVMELYGASPSMLEVEYFEEVGTGLGPTLEFYSTVSKEFSKKKTKLWRENESAAGDEYAFGKHGLFPAPMTEDGINSENGRRITHLFRMMGKFVARAMLDSRIIDISFNPMFFRFSGSVSNGGDAGGHDAEVGTTGPAGAAVPGSLGLAAIKQVDADLYKSLRVIRQFATQKRRIEEDPRLSEVQKTTKLDRIDVQGANITDLGLDFTLPGYPSYELVEGGSQVPVDISNVEQYLDLVIDATLGQGVKAQINAFREGFTQVFPYLALRAFTPAELVMLFGRNQEDWSLETLTDSIKADHGYNMDSKSVRNLLECMSSFDEAQRRDFLQFVTGSPKLPIGGFKALVPMFTVVCKPAEKPLTSDEYLPSVMTCVNYLKLPDYSDIEVMRERLSLAIKEGQGAFHLS